MLISRKFSKRIRISNNVSFCNKMKYFFPGFNSSLDVNARIIPIKRPEKDIKDIKE
ncbi:MAG: hypothetical protein KKF74_00050 [Nanoarchaeota archaeon]|nr:hypothetical protein [Nanoarchaeota archaeon]